MHIVSIFVLLIIFSANALAETNECSKGFGFPNWKKMVNFKLEEAPKPVSNDVYYKFKELMAQLDLATPDTSVDEMRSIMDLAPYKVEESVRDFGEIDIGHAWVFDQDEKFYFSIKTLRLDGCLVNITVIQSPHPLHYKTAISYVRQITEEPIVNRVDKSTLAEQIKLNDNSKPVNNVTDEIQSEPKKLSLNEALKEGLIRLADEEDVNQWAQKKMTEAALAGNLPNVTTDNLLDSFKPQDVVIGHSYVVLSNDFVFHIGLFDKQPITFFIAKGVTSLPYGRPRFSGVYDFNDTE